MREIVLDTETTGFRFNDGDRIVEIGCVELVNHVATGNSYHQYINPERLMPAEAFKVHGLSDEFLSGFPIMAEVIDQFVAFIGSEAPLIIHNAEFDLSHLNNELNLIGMKKIDSDILDTLTLARDKFPGSSISLDALCKRYQIDNSKRTQHTALIDCELLSKVYINLTDQKEPSLNFNVDENKEKQILVNNVSYYKKIIQPSEDEIKNHKNYLKNNLKKNFF